MLNIIPQGNESDDPMSSRILDRSRRFDQSRGVFNIKRRYSSSAISHFRRCVYANDWFHTLLHWSVCRLVVLISLLYLLTIILFGILYYILGKQCDLAMSEFIEALFFSMETMMTIGYSTHDIFFRGCPEMLIVITAESIVGCLLDAFCFGILYCRLSRGNTRACSILFSDKAVIQKIGGRFYFMFRMAELRKHQLIEAHVRCYAIRHVKDKMGKTIHFQSCAMRTMHPDDDLGAMIFLPVPQLVVCCIDAWSPLYPPSFNIPIHQHNASAEYLFPDIYQRAGDVDSGTRDPKQNVSCNNCGLVFTNKTYLKQHMTNKGSNGTKCTPTPSQHSNINISTTSIDYTRENKMSNQITVDKLKEFWSDSKMEVIIVLEGIDAITSFTLQARHSYSYLNNEIVFDHYFAPMVKTATNGSCDVDFSKFHDILPGTNEWRAPQSHT